MCVQMCVCISVCACVLSVILIFQSRYFAAHVSTVKIVYMHAYIHTCTHVLHRCKAPLTIVCIYACIHTYHAYIHTYLHILQRYKDIVKFKTAFYSFYIPVAAGLLLAGVWLCARVCVCVCVCVCVTLLLLVGVWLCALVCVCVCVFYI